jgi:hypothetical protein
LAENPFPQAAKCGYCRSEPLRDIVAVGEGKGRDGADVPELLGERDNAVLIVDLEREVVSVSVGVSVLE